MASLDPLPAELDAVAAAAHAAHRLDLANVDAILARLERARAHLAAPAPPRPDLASPAPSPADELLPLSSFVKTANAKSAQAHKDWGTAVSKLAKTKFSGPPPPLFPAPPAPPPPSTLHPALLALSPAGAPPAPPAPTGSVSVDTPFSRPDAVAALNETIAVHLARIGAFSALDTFLAESGAPTPPALSPDLLESLRTLHAVLADLRAGVCTDALDWVADHPEADPDGDLEFALRKEEFIRLVLASGEGEGEGAAGGHAMETEPLLGAAAAPGTTAAATPLRRRKSSLLRSTDGTGGAPAHPPPDPHAQAALAYGGAHFRALLTPARSATICALLTSPLYLPLPRLLASPYGALFAQHVGSGGAGAGGAAVDALCAAFSAAYLSALELPRDSPLSVVTDVGGGGALAKIMKVRAVMKDKKTEWTAVGELPVEIPLPLPYRYHSIFACPVSKEQSTSQNPPMLLPCGHVIARESLQRLARGTPSHTPVVLANLFDQLAGIFG
ncbi:hypothetical protein Rhopal_003503-T1 [Rhodotorula paludigena]|uniref:RING-Gid-type domain-containing protein n=1 Tax=Rhodotorula paludigena TaxID=86838 RepID=A0AAV5GMB2_9BASI|nr:hypothetical protein Rhopal_003503-T1 [Rhodotorula paludigena]